MRETINSRGQIWIETVVYTIIGLALIGMVLTFALPKIQESKDRLIIEQTIYALSTLDSKILEVAEVPGNVRIVEIRIQKGSLKIDPEKDNVNFSIGELKKPYSEVDSEIKVGRITFLSTQLQKDSAIDIWINYKYEITFNEEESEGMLSYSPLPKRIKIENLGMNSVTGKIKIDISESSGG